MYYKRFFTLLFSLLLISFILHYILYVRTYDEGYNFNSVSNSLFMVGVVGFFPALMAQIGSYKLFYGFQFALRGLFSTDFRRKYRNLSDYIFEKKVDIQTSIYLELLLASGMLMLVAIIFGLLWGRQL